MDKMKPVQMGMEVSRLGIEPGWFRWFYINPKDVNIWPIWLSIYPKGFDVHANLDVIRSFTNLKVMMRANHDVIWWMYIFSRTNKRVCPPSLKWQTSQFCNEFLSRLASSLLGSMLSLPLKCKYIINLNNQLRFTTLKVNSHLSK